MVGIITFHSQYNCGSALQAYALQEKIKSLGYECKILNYYYEKDMRNYDIRWFSKNPKVILFDLYTLKKCIERKNAYKSFQNRFLQLSELTTNWEKLKEISADCDILICGSDQIWNVELTQGVHPAYFLKFATPNQKLISYAPSMALTTVPERYKDDLKNALERFKQISVREQQTAIELEKITRKVVFCALDPTLLHNREFYDKLICEYKITLPEKYIFIYCLHYADLSQIRPAAEEYAKEHGLDIVYFNKYNIYNKLYKKNIFKYGPEAFIAAIKNAEFVFADSYHAAIFSILYKRQFAVYVLEDIRSRWDTLYDRLGMDKNYLNSGEPYHFIDYDKVWNKLEKQREVSTNFLKASLEEAKYER